MNRYGPWLTQLAAFGLPGADVQLPAAPLDDGQWAALMGAVVEQRLQGLLLHAIAEGALPVTRAQGDEAIERHVEAMLGVLEIERRLLEVVAILDEAGLDHRVLKGSAYAHLAYRSPAMRAFGDADVLVRTDDWEGATVLLLRSGFARHQPELRPGFDRRFGKGVTLIGEDGFQLDLHRTFVHPPFGLQIDLDGLFTTATPFTVGGVDLRALGREERCLHACYHAALGNVPPRLVPLRDVAEHVLDPALDHARVLALARAWAGTAVVARGVRTAWQELQLADAVPLSVWAHRYEPDAVEARALACYVGPQRTYGRKMLATLRCLPGLREKAALIADLGLPRRSYLQDQGATYTGWWARGRRAVVRGAGR